MAAVYRAIQEGRACAAVLCVHQHARFGPAAGPANVDRVDMAAGLRVLPVLRLRGLQRHRHWAGQVDGHTAAGKLRKPILPTDGYALLANVAYHAFELA